MRRVKLGRELTGEKRITMPAGKQRASLRYDAYRLLKDDGRLSVQMFVKCAAEQLAVAYTKQGYPMTAVPAYEEQIEEIHNPADPTHQASDDWPHGTQRTFILYFGLPKS